jgi:tetratricopeptide (TPR) repeat protein
MQGEQEVDPTFLQRAEREPEDFQAQLEAAYACDRAGHEERAIGYYEAAYRLGFPEGFERAGFLLGFGSTLKNVGRLAESEAILRDALAGEVETDALGLFLALTLQAQGRHHEALAQALEVCLQHPSPSVARYSRALREYISELRG